LIYLIGLIKIEKLIFSKEIDDQLLKIEVTKFKDIDYIHFRWWYKTFDEEYLPSDKGISIPMNLESIKVIMQELSTLMSIKDIENLLHERKNTKIPGESF